MSSKMLPARRAVSLLILILLFAGVQLAAGQEAGKTWEDASTGLMWTVEDNGVDLNWNQANAHCEELTLGGQSDWRLPKLEELEGLYDRSLKKQYKTREPINVQAGNVWTGSKNTLGDAWMFNFGYGGSSISPTGGGGCGVVGRTLCTRGGKGK